MTEKLPPGSPCTNCGKCCTNHSYMGTLEASGDDVKRWRREGRDDILRFAYVLGKPNDPWADLWVDENGNERHRCPFVRKVTGTDRYLCSIYDTRPAVCRNYVAWTDRRHNVCEIPDGWVPPMANEHDPRSTEELRTEYLQGKLDHPENPQVIELCNAGLALLDAEVAVWDATAKQKPAALRRLMRAQQRMDAATKALDEANTVIASALLKNWQHDTGQPN